MRVFINYFFLSSCKGSWIWSFRSTFLCYKNSFEVTNNPSRLSYVVSLIEHWINMICFIFAAWAMLYWRCGTVIIRNVLQSNIDWRSSLMYHHVFLLPHCGVIFLEVQGSISMSAHLVRTMQKKIITFDDEEQGAKPWVSILLSRPRDFRTVIHYLGMWVRECTLSSGHKGIDIFS